MRVVYCESFERIWLKSWIVMFMCILDLFNVVVKENKYGFKIILCFMFENGVEEDWWFW